MEPISTSAIPWTDILVALTALYAAIISTYTLLKDWRKDKPRLKVTTGWGVTTSQIGLSESQVIVTAMNTGFLPITIAAVGMNLPDGKTNQLINVPSEFSLPHELLPGRSCTFFIDEDVVITELFRNGYEGDIEIRAYCRSQIGDSYESNPYKLSI